MSEIITTLREVSALLGEFQIPYAVMGGLAVRAHGLPRPTYDLDFTIALARNRLVPLFDRLDDLGYTVPEIYRLGWIDQVANMPLIKFNLMIQGNAIAVDVFLAETAFLQSVIARRERTEINEVPVDVVSPEDLILLKAIARRPRDIGDIIDVRFMQSELDLSYLRHWAAELGITEQFEEIWRESTPP